MHDSEPGGRGAFESAGGALRTSAGVISRTRQMAVRERVRVCAGMYVSEVVCMQWNTAGRVDASEEWVWDGLHESTPVSVRTQSGQYLRC